MILSENTTVAIVGLGYVGLPLGIEFGKVRRTIGFDLSDSKIQNCKANIDPMGEVSPQEFKASKFFEYTNQPSILSEADVVIICVPTPIDQERNPDLSFVENAFELVGKNLKENAVVVLESTVYPGVTEDVGVPILEKHSKGIWKETFFVGYSPERINPGDPSRTVRDIIKVVAGDTEHTTEFLAQLYGQIIVAGIFEASSIQVAEASKVIENTQRDINIALMNELAMIFSKLGLNTTDVLAAANTKWNFLNFQPGLVGGHCIGIDPYYLMHKAKKLDYDPEIITAGRKINDNMSKFIAERAMSKMLNNGLELNKSEVAILGVTFKENCPDIRNSKVFDLRNHLIKHGCRVDAHDPIAQSEDCEQEFGVDLMDWQNLSVYDCIILAVPHEYYLGKQKSDFLSKLKSNGVLIDVKSAVYQKLKNTDHIDLLTI